MGRRAGWDRSPSASTRLPTGCNPNTTAGDTWADQLVLEPVLPSAFIVTPAGSSTYDSAVISQAEVVSTTPQTVVYTIDPKAVWSDGVPITAADFIYAWQPAARPHRSPGRHRRQRGLAPSGTATSSR